MNFLSPLIRNSRTHYEPQLRAENHRMCGAAALAMAYRNCDLSVDQPEIWNQISEPFQGKFRARTCLMASDAIARELACLTIQTHQPWKILRQCWRNNIAVVLNHRVGTNSTEGHYSVLAGCGDHSILINDPLQGPEIELSHEDFQKLWLPNSPESEISGNILLAIARRDEQPSLWCHCDRPLEDFVNCNHCGFQIPLQPALALGCWNRNCPDRNWWRLFCPNCDHSVEEITD